MYLKTYTLIFIVFYCVSAMANAAKCDKYKTKLEKIQSQQRLANSVKKSNKLKERELKAFKKWRKCQQGKLKK
ncbi:hypothetical protein HII17_09850 [Thalassotalea sp. M1531]|uniref:DUF1090 family protein n=1 Tax=Thalassotalea algicola TaxID=2716224 RepID=A0A7Y0LCW1_9GAMM|nr:hypothetical protein [Thalassotalea algicola]NMP31868.1 hypothetical protein [Thalassotalea algicola]